MKKIQLFLLTFLFITGFCFATLSRHIDNPDLTLNNHGIECQCQTSESYVLSDIPEDKIYLTPNQVIVSDKGLFALIDGVTIKITQIQCDQNGPYIRASMFEKRCWNGHPVLCETCSGCARLLCQFRCKCWAN